MVLKFFPVIGSWTPNSATNQMSKHNISSPCWRKIWSWFETYEINLSTSLRYFQNGKCDIHVHMMTIVNHHFHGLNELENRQTKTIVKFHLCRKKGTFHSLRGFLKTGRDSKKKFLSSQPSTPQDNFAWALNGQPVCTCLSLLWFEKTRWFCLQNFSLEAVPSL